MVDRVRSGEWLFWFSLAAVTLLHIQLAYLALTWSPEKIGASQRPTLAISINLEASDTLDAAHLSATLRPAASGMPGENAQNEPEKPEQTELKPADKPVEEDTDPNPESRPEPEPIPEPEAEILEPQPEPLPESEPESEPLPELKNEPLPEPKAEPLPKPETEPLPKPASEPLEKYPKEDTTLQDAEAALERAMLAEIKKREEAEREAQKRKQERNRRAEKKSEQPERKRRQRTAGDGAGGDRGSQVSRGAVSATTGSIRNYAAQVRARIARNKPPSRGQSGQIEIAFSISTSGDLRNPRVTRSSGNKTLDSMALSAVRRSAPFPRPPAGSRANQLHFRMLFTFTFQ